MAVKKKVASTIVGEPTVTSHKVQQMIYPLTIDYGREDINDIARKVNEIITHLNL